MNPGDRPAWGADWAWGLPLILLTVVFHAYFLSRIVESVSHRLDGQHPLGHLRHTPILIVGGTALAATILHGVEGTIWAVVYRLLGASPDFKSAVLYSLEAMTSYGHENLFLAPHWRLLGALEALSGWILFGLTTAFLFAVIQRAWPNTRAGRPRLLEHDAATSVLNKSKSEAEGTNRVTATL
ncbi:MAG: hypothetical protein WBX16_22130 [Candidatus Acidiferrales bacterium]